MAEFKFVTRACNVEMHVSDPMPSITSLTVPQSVKHIKLLDTRTGDSVVLDQFMLEFLQNAIKKHF